MYWLKHKIKFHFVIYTKMESQPKAYVQNFWRLLGIGLSLILDLNISKINNKTSDTNKWQLITNVFTKKLWKTVYL